MIVKLKTQNEVREFRNIWNIQSNVLDHKRELSLVGYDHIVVFRDSTKNVELLEVRFE